MMEMILNYFHTIRFLKPAQLYNRLWFCLYRPKPDLKSRPEIRLLSGKWCETTHRESTLLSPSRFCFLNKEREISTSGDWNHTGWEKLWLYNLHYFDDLNADGADIRHQWHLELIQRWIRENPPASGVGWEPYPVSIRIANWIKWTLTGNGLPEEAIHSLAVQTRYLCRRLERHLLGNHLIANAKALLFAGYYFKGVEADHWKATGEKILLKELNEQILPDDGHFERSPMYHSIVLEDVLDCLNLLNAYGLTGNDLRGLLMEKAGLMLKFLADILHPDGNIPFFNDCAFGVTAPPRELFGYAGRLGIGDRRGIPTRNVIGKPDFGLWVIKSGEIHVIVDAGPIGPDYLPGHAHCDTLSYEMSVAGKRFIVNSGTYAYEGPERNLFRSTAAHNTVRIDDEEQHEIWANFRVARRGYPFDVSIEENNEECWFEGAHDGYGRLKGNPVHRRKILLSEGKMSVEDSIEGSGTHQGESYIHLHPDVEVVSTEANEVLCNLDGNRVTIRSTSDGSLQVENGFFSPEFGKKVGNKAVVLRKKGSTPFAINYEILIH